jgi:hypothetical protein
VAVLGASSVCEGALYPTYAVLAALLPPRTQLHIVMVGPQLSVPKEAIGLGGSCDGDGGNEDGDGGHGDSNGGKGDGGGGKGNGDKGCNGDGTVCYRCDATGVVVRVSFVVGLYHKLAAAGALRTATLAFAPNAGLCEYASWGATIDALRGRGVPLCFSSYAMVEVDAALAELWEGHGVAAESVSTEVNPFRMPLDEARKVTGGAIAVPWIPNAVLSYVH